MHTGHLVTWRLRTNHYMVAKYLCTTVLDFFVVLADSVAHLHFKGEFDMLAGNQVQSYFHQLMITYIVLGLASYLSSGHLEHPVVAPTRAVGTLSDMALSDAYMTYVAYDASDASASAWQAAIMDQ